MSKNMLLRYACILFAATFLPMVALANFANNVPIISSSLETAGTSECRGPMKQEVPYLDALRIAIERCFVFPPYLEEGAKCEAQVSQTPQGLVTRVKIRDCTGHPKFADFVERAALKASPLPRPKAASSFLPTFGIVVFSPNVAKHREALHSSPPIIRELSITPAPWQPPPTMEEIQNHERKFNDFLDATPGKRFVTAQRAGNYQPYVDECVKKLFEVGNSHYPREAQGKFYGTVIITIEIRPSGELEGLKLDKSSGYKILDDAAMNASRLAAPFKSFPPEMAEKVTSLSITTPFTFSNSNNMRNENNSGDKQNIVGIDYVKKMVTMMGTIDQMDQEAKDGFHQFKLRDPKNEKYYQCLEDSYSSDALIEKLKPHYRRIFTDRFLREWYEFLTTDTGKKIVQLVRAGPPFDIEHAKLSQKEMRELKEFYPSLKKYTSAETNFEIQQAIQSGAQELFTEMRTRCRPFRASF